MPRTLVAYHTPNPLTMAKRMTMTTVSAGWRSGCAIILMYIASPSIRVRKTTIIGKLCFFCVMLSSHFDIYADFKDLGICSCPKGYDVNLFHRQAGEKGTSLTHTPFLSPAPRNNPMKLLAFNGSPRKKWNTTTLLEHALKGAESEGAKTELIHLYDLDYKGCVSCFACKRIGSKSYGHCAHKDALTRVFKKVEAADAILIGSPIYYSITTGETRCFLERLMFQYSVYDKERTSLFGRKIRTGFIYTAGAKEEMVREMGFDRNAQLTEMAMARIFGSCESMFVTDTLQFDDYSKYVSTLFDPAEKEKHRKEQFPKDCKKAYGLGARLVRKGA